MIRPGVRFALEHYYTMRSLLFTILLTVIAIYANSQTPNFYVFRQSTETYTELVNDTTVPGAYVNPTGTWMLDLNGDKFYLFDKQYELDNTNRHIVFSNNGFLRIEDDSTFIVLDAMFTQVDSIDNNTQLSYIVDGNPGNRRIKVQWQNLALHNGQAGNYVNYQIWFHELTGIFEIHYGPSSANNSSGYTTSSGPNIGLFYALKNFTKMFEKIWVNGAPGSYTLDSTRSTSFSAVSGVPPAGTVFKFIPKKFLLDVEHEPVQGQIKVYPNPADEKIQLSMANAFNEGDKLVLVDMQGRVVKELYPKDGTSYAELETQNLPPGNYELQVSGSISLNKKILIQHQ